MKLINFCSSTYNSRENEVKILVPGCGVGRLTYELACRGYECEGNEFSYFMLIASNFVLNCCAEENMYTLYPWVHHNVNNLRRSDQVTAVRFPDVCPAKNKPLGLLSVVAGDFLEVSVKVLTSCYVLRLLYFSLSGLHKSQHIRQRGHVFLYRLCK